MTMFKQRCMQQLQDLLKDTQGNTLMLVGLGIFALMGAAGSAIDMGRAQMVQAKLSAALDAAGLAAGATANSQDINTQAQKYFDANYPTNYLSSEVTDFDVDMNDQIISLNATAEVETNFMQVLGIDEVTVTASSEITRANKGLELVLVLDNTGSMTQTAGGGVSKINALKTASADLINILYGDKATLENVWIGIVPFSQAVNVGSSRSLWTTNDTFNWGTTSWAGCVDARETSNRDVTDDPPSTAKFPKYYWPCDSNNKWYGTNSNRDNCSTSGTIKYHSGLGTSLGPNKNCPQSLLAMTSDKTSILNNITSMQAVGNTHINLGLAWGWRMLSPRWRTLWGGEMNTEELPLDYNTPLMNKVIVLMTDGDNTMDNSNHTAYWYLSNNKLGTTTQSTAESRLDSRTTTVCNSLKANNVIIYTVALGTNISNSSLNMLSGCASKSAYFFNSPTTADLQQAFHTIGDSLANLRISK